MTILSKSSVSLISCHPRHKCRSELVLNFFLVIRPSFHIIVHISCYFWATWAVYSRKPGHQNIEDNPKFFLYHFLALIYHMCLLNHSRHGNGNFVPVVGQPIVFDHYQVEDGSWKPRKIQWDSASMFDHSIQFNWSSQSRPVWPPKQHLNHFVGHYGTFCGLKLPMKIWQPPCVFSKKYISKRN